MTLSDEIRQFEDGRYIFKTDVQNFIKEIKEKPCISVCFVTCV